MIDFQRSADGTKIAFERAGEGPALIIVGGALNSRRSADVLVPWLSPHFTVYTYDRRGRGESSDTLPYSRGREIEDLEALIAAAGGSAYAYGHSSGAILALEAAAAGAAISKLAAYEPPYLTGNAPEEPWETFRDRVQAALDEGDREGAVELFIRHTGSDFDEGIKTMPWWPALLSVANTLPYDLTLTSDGNVPERLSNIQVPTLGIYGGTSPSWAENAINAVAAAVPGMKKVELEGQDHAVANDAVAPVLINFFQQHSGLVLDIDFQGAVTECIEDGSRKTPPGGWPGGVSRSAVVRPGTDRAAVLRVATYRSRCRRRDLSW